MFHNRLLVIVHGDDIAGVSRVGQHLSVVCSVHVICVGEACYDAAATSIISIFDGHYLVLKVLLLEMLYHNISTCKPVSECHECILHREQHSLTQISRISKQYNLNLTHPDRPCVIRSGIARSKVQAWSKALGIRR